MGNINVCGVVVSRNAKTGMSLNMDRGKCKPSAACALCYMKKVTGADVPRLRALFLRKYGLDVDVKANTGPITWPRQQAAYLRNRETLTAMVARGRAEHLGAALAYRLREFDDAQPFRACGGGDLFEELVSVLAFAAAHGLKIYGYSRRPNMILLLRDACVALGLRRAMWPWFFGSTDPTMSRGRVRALEEATERLNGTRQIAYMSLTGELPAWGVDVAFGYHASGGKTVMDWTEACPATNGRDISCHACRRCFGRYA